MAILEAILALVQHRRGLSEAESYHAMEAILNGAATEAQIAALLVALHLKGETAEEITGAAKALRAAAAAPQHTSHEPLHTQQEPLLDTCGTGGDRSGTFNISTIAALVAAGTGLRVAKHGNRSLSSVCGSADLLEALGVNLAYAATTLDTSGIAFFFAPLFHGATRHVQPVRAQLKFRTIFNYLGPLSNPAGANVQIAGAFSASAAELMAHVFRNLGLRKACTVYGTDGLDEVTTTGPTLLFEVCGNAIELRTLLPSDFGLAAAQPGDLAGGSIERNCEIALAILHGAPGPQREIVLANAALALRLAGRVSTLLDGMRAAALSLDSGQALAKLNLLRRQ